MAVVAPPRAPRAVPATGLPTREVLVDGLRLRVAEAGPADHHDRGGRPPLLVIPGHTARIEGLEPLVRRLAAHHRVVVADLPGSGYSDHPVRRYDLGFYEDVLLGLLDELGIDEAIPVGGSLGGNLVLRLGHRAPGRFPRLVAWAPGSAWPARPRLAAAMRAVGGRALFWPTVWGQSRFWYAADFDGREAALAETFAYYREVLGPGFVRMYWGIAADQVATSLFALAPAVSQPTLLLWGDLDHGAGMGRGVARLARELGDCRLVVLRGARHSIETERPDEVADHVLEFLR